MRVPVIRPCGARIREAERHVTSKGCVLLLDPQNLARYTRQDWAESVCPILVGWKSGPGRVCRPGWEPALEGGRGKSAGLKKLCRRLGLSLGQAERRLDKEGRAWSRSRNPESPDERRRRLGRESARGETERERYMLELNRTGACARCEKPAALGAYRSLPSGEEVRTCDVCAAIYELEDMERGAHKYGGYLGNSQLHGGAGEVANFLGFPLVVLHSLYRGSAGWGGDSWHWRGWDRWNREWYGWNSGPHMRTNMTLIKGDRGPGRDVYDLGVTFQSGLVARLRSGQDEWLQEHGGEALPFRFNPERGREAERRAEREAGDLGALVAQARELERSGQPVPYELTGRIFAAQHGIDSIVTYPTGKRRKVKNLGWLRRQLHRRGGSLTGTLLPLRFVVRAVGPFPRECYLRVELSDTSGAMRAEDVRHTHTFETMFASCHHLWDWLQTPLFESEVLDWDGRVGRIERRMHESTYGHPTESEGGPDAECYRCSRRYFSGDPEASPHEVMCPTCYFGTTRRTRNPEERRRRRGRQEGQAGVRARAEAAVQEGRAAPLEWLIATQTDFDLHLNRTNFGGYTPVPGVLGNRWARTHEDQVFAIGKALYGNQFHGEQDLGHDRYWVTHRDNRDRQRWETYQARLKKAYHDAGYDTKTIRGELYVLLPGRVAGREAAAGREAVEAAWRPYVEWLRSQGGASERLYAEEEL